MESSQIVTMHIQSVDQNKAIKSIKHTITELDRSKIEEQKKAVRSGYDMDIIPSDLATYGRDAKALLKELQSQNERMFLLTFLVMNTGETEQELETNVFQMCIRDRPCTRLPDRTQLHRHPSPETHWRFHQSEKNICKSSSS